jgi:hypothetical protein
VNAQKTDETERALVEAVAATMEAKRLELIHQPLAFIWKDLARTAIAALSTEGMVMVPRETFDALRGDPDCPEISPQSWLFSMIDYCKERARVDEDDEDPMATLEMISEVEHLHKNLKSMIAASPSSMERGNE